MHSPSPSPIPSQYCVHVIQTFQCHTLHISFYFFLHACLSGVSTCLRALDRAFILLRSSTSVKPAPHSAPPRQNNVRSVTMFPISLFIWIYAGISTTLLPYVGSLSVRRPTFGRLRFLEHMVAFFATVTRSYAYVVASW